MAATTYTAKSFASPALALTSFPGVIKRINKAEDFTIAASENDVIKFFKLPVNAKILNGGFFGETLGAAGTFDLIVSDGTTTKVLLNEAVVTASTYSYDALVMANTGLTGSVVGETDPADWGSFVTTNDDYYVALRVGATQVTTPTAGNVQCWIEYTLMLEGGEVV